MKAARGVLPLLTVDPKVANDPKVAKLRVAIECVKDWRDEEFGDFVKDIYCDGVNAGIVLGKQIGGLR
jgi:hypothetical protein